MERSRNMRSGNSYFLPSPMISVGGWNEKNGMPQRVKYILVTGGVCSSLGKGVTTSAIGALLKASGYRVSSIKIDPYINVDAGLMSPFEHGEVYVLKDGGEVDLDLGNYERWMGIKLTRDHNITTGKIYQSLINRERNGMFLGKTVTLVPHFTNEVVEKIEHVAHIPIDGSSLLPQICMIELGGTIGDFESSPFVEALRTLRFTLPPEDFCLVHCAYLPTMGGCPKTKPTQHSCHNLLGLGMSADFLVCRSEGLLEDGIRSKLSQLCGIKEKYIIDAPNVSCLYEIPCLFAEQDIVAKIKHKLLLDECFKNPIPPLNFPGVKAFKEFTRKLREPKKAVNIAFVGKYMSHGTDAYFSVMQTFEHTCIELQVKIEFLWMDAEVLEGDGEEAVKAAEQLKKCDGIFVPGGFGKRCLDGKIKAVQIARENKIPFLGICLGLQIAVIEMSRNLLGLKNATSAEFESTDDEEEEECGGKEDCKASEKNSEEPISTKDDGKDNGEKGKNSGIGENGRKKNHVIIYMKPPECNTARMGANMRLGLCDCYIIDRSPSSILNTIYGTNVTLVQERHRHRYEFNMEYRAALEGVGMKLTGVSDPKFGPECRLEAIELDKEKCNHPFFFAVQYHPEFISTPYDPSPPYLAFVIACAKLNYEWPLGINSRAVVV